MATTGTLSDMFTRHASDSLRAELSELAPADLEAALGAIVSRATTEWPEILVDTETFLGFVAKRCNATADLAALRAEDLYIACACAERADGAVEQLRERYWPKLQAALRAQKIPAEDIADIGQRLWEMLFVASEGKVPTIATYAGRGNLGGWLRSITLRTAWHGRRAAQCEGGKAASDDQLHELPAAQDDPEIETLKARYRVEFGAAFREAMAALTPRQRNVLRQHFIDGLNIDQLGTMYRVHRATAARWLASARAELFEGTKTKLCAVTAGTESEVESIIRLVRSQLDFSIHELLG